MNTSKINHNKQNSALWLADDTKKIITQKRWFFLFSHN